MVWVYSDPLTKDELQVQSYLEKTLKKRSYTLKIVKLLSLFNYLRSKKFNSAKEIQSDILMKKDTPLFDNKSASEVFKSLYKKRGGGEYPFTESIIEGMGNFLKRNDPIGVAWLFENGMWIVTLPVKVAKGIVGDGIYDLVSGTTHGLIETSVSGINGLAESIGGPFGIAIVIIFTGIAALAGSTLAAAEGDFSQAFIHFLNLIPAVGPALVKGVNKAEHLAKIVDKHRTDIDNVPFGEYITSAVPKLESDEATPAAGGNRRRTRRKKHRRY
jgi:hypothetical protein